MIQPGFYRHHGGGFYTVLFCAEDSTNARERPDGTQPLVVVYVSHTTGKVLTRDLAEFVEAVPWPETFSPIFPIAKGEKRPRFMRWTEPEHAR